MISLLPMIAGLGIDFIKDLVSDHGEDLVTEGIKKVTGIDLSKKDKITPEQAERIRAAEFQLKQLDFEKMKEENRHSEHLDGLKVGDKQNARGATHLHEMQTSVANRIYTQSSYVIPALLVLNVVIVIVAEKFAFETSVVVAVSNLIGIALNNAYRERQSVLEFLFGSSVGSKTKEMK